MRLSKYIRDPFLSLISINTSYSQDTNAISISFNEIDIPNCIGLKGSNLCIYYNSIFNKENINFLNKQQFLIGFKKSVINNKFF